MSTTMTQEKLVQPSVNRDSAFHKLVEDLSRKLGPCSGIDSDDVDVEELKDLMRHYDSNPAEWSKYALSDSSRGYTRNLVDEGNGKSNLILKGSLQETRYSWPDQDLVKAGREAPPEIQKQTMYHENEVTYISDKIGLHKITNLDPNEFAVSLHLYTPPNAARDGCHVFSAETGKANLVPCNFFSTYGKKVSV
ncbi:MAG: hypothetical protein M1834_008393 [Cirrosporium novae-zelandiae]|nr:MAG: hypothetical protein M1834_008393 [Cirrosporium novae-zelandiae]